MTAFVQAELGHLRIGKQMNADQFRVSEHLSYEIPAALYYAGLTDPRKTDYSVERMNFFTTMTVSWFRCRFYLFPDWQFNAQEFVKR